MSHPQTEAGLWRFFPVWILAGLGLVVAVNFYMAFSAVRSFPGTATDADFATSNRYDRVLEDAARQARLGWALTAEVQGGVPAIVLKGADGKPLEGARVVATAQRPAGGQADVRMDLRATLPGRYVAARALPAEGQWDLQLYVSAGGQEFRATRRVLVP